MRANPSWLGLEPKISSYADECEATEPRRHVAAPGQIFSIRETKKNAFFEEITSWGTENKRSE
jgi:hypothetical protein